MKQRGRIIVSGILGLVAAANMALAQTTMAPDTGPLVPPDRAVRDERVPADRAVVVEERVVERRPEGEFYVAGFGGFTLGQGFSNVDGRGTLATQNNLGNLDTANSVIYGMKAGYFLPGRWNWLGLEVEGFNTTPNLKQQDGLIGSHLRVTTMAFNVIARKRLGCRNNNRDHYDRTRHATYDKYGRHYEKDGQHYDGWSPEDENERCPLQVYAGVGPAIFFAETSNQFGRSGDAGEVGVNALTGIKYFVHRNVAIFGEYKFNYAGFDFTQNQGTTAGIQGNYKASHFVGGLAIHF